MCYNKGTKERGTDREQAENREVEGLGAEMPTHRSVPTFLFFFKKVLDKWVRLCYNTYRNQEKKELIKYENLRNSLCKNWQGLRSKSG